MGMFDTLIFPVPVKCRQCGDEIESTQTKAVSNLMQTFQVGDTIDSRFLSGVLEERLFCDTCSPLDQKVYVVIYHRILIDVVEDPEVAHERLKRMSAKDLRPLYHAMGAQLVRWRVDYHRLYDAVATYRKYLMAKSAPGGDEKDESIYPCFTVETPLLCLLSQVEEHPTTYQRPPLRWNPSLAELLKRQHELYERVEKWRRKYNTLQYLVRDYAKWIQLSPKEQEEKTSQPLFHFWNTDAKECAEAKDPLARLLEKADTDKVSYLFL